MCVFKQECVEEGMRELFIYGWHVLYVCHVMHAGRIHGTLAYIHVLTKRMCT